MYMYELFTLNKKEVAMKLYSNYLEEYVNYKLSKVHSIIY